MEDGLILADEKLRKKLSDDFPACYERCQKRRKFMKDILSIHLPEESIAPVEYTGNRASVLSCAEQHPAS